MTLLALAAALSSLASHDATAAAKRGTDPKQHAESSPDASAQDVIPVEVRADVYVLTVDGDNVTVQFGPDGVIVIDPGPPHTGDAVLAAIRKISARPIRYLIDTSADPDHVGNNAVVAMAGQSMSEATGLLTLATNPSTQGATIIAHENVPLEMVGVGAGTADAYPGKALPKETYNRAQKNFYMNGQAVEIFAAPAAHSDGDSLVLFRRSDVVVAGDVLDETRFPVIDLAHGGSIQGEIAALNRLLNLVIPVTPQPWRPGGTVLVPARGHLCEQAEVVQYRDMVTIIRDRVQDLIAQGKTLEQVKAAKPTLGYTPRYGANSGPWTTDMFVEAVYKSLKGAKP